MTARLRNAFNPAHSARLVLGVSGTVAVAIAGTILFAPEAFYGSYGIAVGADPTLANELKAPAGTLLIAGLLMFAGIVRRRLVRVSLITAAAIYLSYGLSRVLSIVLDGMPDSGMVSAAALELVIGVICVLTLEQMRRFPGARDLDQPEAA
jgi:hypothetical protein